MGQIIESMDAALAEEVGQVLVLSTMERLLEDTSVDFLPSLIEVFEAESAQRLESIKNSFAVSDMAVLAVEAHSLKGTSATFGAEKLRAVSEKVEKAAKIGDESVVNENVPLIPELLKEVLESLNKFSKGLGQ